MIMTQQPTVQIFFNKQQGMQDNKFINSLVRGGFYWVRGAESDKLEPAKLDYYRYGHVLYFFFTNGSRMEASSVFEIGYLIEYEATLFEMPSYDDIKERMSVSSKFRDAVNDREGAVNKLFSNSALNVIKKKPE